MSPIQADRFNKQRWIIRINTSSHCSQSDVQTDSNPDQHSQMSVIVLHLAARSPKPQVDPPSRGTRGRTAKLEDHMLR